MHCRSSSAAVPEVEVELVIFRGLEEETGSVKSQAYLDGTTDRRKAKSIFSMLGLNTKALQHSCLAGCTFRHWVLLFTGVLTLCCICSFQKSRQRAPKGIWSSFVRGENLSSNSRSPEVRDLIMLIMSSASTAPNVISFLIS